MQFFKIKLLSLLFFIISVKLCAVQPEKNFPSEWYVSGNMGWTQLSGGCVLRARSKQIGSTYHFSEAPLRSNGFLCELGIGHCFFFSNVYLAIGPFINFVLGLKDTKYFKEHQFAQTMTVGKKYGMGLNVKPGFLFSDNWHVNALLGVEFGQFQLSWKEQSDSEKSTSNALLGFNVGFEVLRSFEWALWGARVAYTFYQKKTLEIDDDNSKCQAVVSPRCLALSVMCVVPFSS